MMPGLKLMQSSADKLKIMDKLHIFSEVKGFKIPRRRLLKIFKCFLRDGEIKIKLKKNFRSKIAVNLVFVEEDAMKKLNELWKGGRGGTDVLTFNYGEKWEGINGEIYICVKVAERNVKEDLKEKGRVAEELGSIGKLSFIGKSWVNEKSGLIDKLGLRKIPKKELDKSLRKGLAEEISKLFVHGLLHLCGWTHETPGKYAKMMKKTAIILERCP
jgi:ssRNA-specific RNase YbeY (16S rRNA maturation enzyme)